VGTYGSTEGQIQQVSHSDRKLVEVIDLPNRQDSCPLFRLSAEIRHRIYGLVLGGMDIHVDCFEDWMGDGEVKPKIRRCVVDCPEQVDHD